MLRRCRLVVCCVAGCCVVVCVVVLCLRCAYCCIVLRGVDVGVGFVVCVCIRLLI